MAAGDPQSATCTRRQHPTDVWDCGVEYSADCPTILLRMTVDQHGVAELHENENQTPVDDVLRYPYCGDSILNQK